MSNYRYLNIVIYNLKRNKNLLNFFSRFLLFTNVSELLFYTYIIMYTITVFISASR